MATKNTPPILLAHKWEDQDPTGWWMSEKLDGVRAYWDGSRFLSRQGNTFNAPEWFTRGLPKVVLDGELWVGRGEFQKCVSIVRKSAPHEGWRAVQYVLFDAPHQAPFEARLAYIDSIVGDYVRPLPQEICRGVDHLTGALAAVEAKGGEGLMLRKPGSRYEAGRSRTLLKVKTFVDDEARVIGHLPGEGKHKGRLGALDAVLKNGTRFSIGTGFSDAERENPPKIGSIVTFRYFELTKDGVPRFPAYLRLRSDIDAASW
jgi:DNA ligase